MTDLDLTGTDSVQHWTERYSSAVMDTFGPPQRVLVRGEGCYVWDADGQRYLDLLGGIAVNALGHAHPTLTAAVSAQLGTIGHISNFFASPTQIALAERLIGLTGAPTGSRVFFANSGTEANEAALLVATNHRRSHQILAVRNSYHGRTYATMGVTGNRGWSASALNPLQVAWLHSGERLRGLLARLDAADRVDAAVEDLREVLATQTTGDVACLIAEPVQGVGGFVHGPDGLFAAWKKVLDEHGILLISDEVQTGWGRTGEHFWGYQAHGVTPDLLTFAKGVGNGFALADQPRLPVTPIVAYDRPW